jgi:hypothetical protein
MRRRDFLGTVAGASVGWAVAPGVAQAGVAESVGATTAVSASEYANTRASVTVYPGETVGLYGALPGGKFSAKAVAVAWRGRPAVTRELAFEGGEAVAYGAYPFEESRPVRLEFAGKAVCVNRPRVDWVEHQTVYAGQRLRLFGRNLHCVNAVALAGGGKTAYLQQVSAAPYVFEARVPACAVGGYDVVVDGALVGHVDVVARGSDPLALEVEWAGKFKWDAVSTVTLEKSPADSTGAIQAALDAAGKSGGGVVMLPEGEFGIRHLDLPAGVVLMGAGQGITVLRYLGGEPAMATHDAPSIYMHMQMVTWENSHPMLNASAGNVGVARLSLVSDVALPDDQHRRIEGYVQGIRVDARNDRYVFVSDVDMQLENGSGMHLSIGSDAIVQRCRVFAPCTSVSMNTHTADGRSSVRNCTLSNQQRPVVEFNTSHAVLEDNHLVGRNKWLKWCNGEHRISDHGASPGTGGFTHQYIANNVADGVFGTPDENDGEGMNFQQTTRLAYAGVTAADAKTFTDSTQNFAPGVLKGTTIVIVRGRGLGQVRTIVDNTATSVTVEPAWDAVPDAKSLYTIDKEISAYGCIIVNNQLEGVKKRAVDLYCKNYDNWIQGNLIVNAGGIFLNANETTTGKRLDMAYFNVVRDNVVMGQAMDPKTGLPQQKLIGTDHGLGWGIRIGNVGKSKNTIPGVCVYGNEVRNNTIYGPTPDGRAAGIIIGVDTLPDAVSALGTIIENNEIHDMPVGIRLGGHVAGSEIRGNRFFLKGVDKQEVETGGPF